MGSPHLHCSGLLNNTVNGTCLLYSTYLSAKIYGCEIRQVNGRNFVTEINLPRLCTSTLG